MQFLANIPDTDLSKIHGYVRIIYEKCVFWANLPAINLGNDHRVKKTELKVSTTMLYTVK